MVICIPFFIRLVLLQWNRHPKNEQHCFYDIFTLWWLVVSIEEEVEEKAKVVAAESFYSIPCRAIAILYQDNFEEKDEFILFFK